MTTLEVSATTALVTGASLDQESHLLTAAGLSPVQ
jgi:hypothetical protein